MQMKKAVPYLVGIAMLFGIGYQQNQIDNLTSKYESLLDAQSKNENRMTASLNAMHNSIVLGLGYVDSNGKRISDLEKTQSRMREMDKETRRAVGILARDSKRTNLEPYPLDDDHSLNNW